MVVVSYRMSVSGVGCRILTVDCRVSVSVIVVVSLLSGVGCRVLTDDCRVSVSMVVKLILYCWVSVSLTFSIIGAQLCLFVKVWVRCV